MLAGTRFRVKVKDESRQSRRAGCSEVLNRCEAKSPWRKSHVRGAGPLGLRWSLLSGLARCRNGRVSVKRSEGKTLEDGESDQEGEREDAPQG